MHRFKRLYLLWSIAFSFIIPLIKITATENVPVASVEQVIFQPVNDLAKSITSKTIINAGTKDYLPTIRKIKAGTAIKYQQATLILTNDQLIPHSFLRYIFINKELYESGSIEKEILAHELTHVQQKHSLDIILAELILIVCWFNPFIYLYRKAIPLNHEFLADEAVVKNFNDCSAYQYLLLEKATQRGSLSLTSQFNYSITKKRLLMITTHTSKKMAVIKQLSVLALIVAATVIFSGKTLAQEPAKVIRPAQKEVPHTIEGASPEQMKEYETIINKYKTDDKKWMIQFSSKISAAERERLETIFKQMSTEQQAKQIVAFGPPAGPLPRVVPSPTELESFKNAAVYGVWIDDKKITNVELKKYTNTDFEQVFVSKLYGGAKKGRSYTRQVNLMTKAYYEDYNKKTLANKNMMMVGFRMETK